MAESVADELVEAQRYYEQARGLYQQVATTSEQMAGVYSELGNLALIRGDAVNAQRGHHDALLLNRGEDAVSQQIKSATLNSLALAFAMQGDLIRQSDIRKKRLPLTPNLI